MSRHGGKDLVRRLRALQERRHALTAAKDHVGAHQALDLAVSLIDPTDLPTLREALLHATNPAHTPPVPVVLGPQDVAAVVGVEEIMSLVYVYSTGCTYWGRAFERRDLKTAHEVERRLEAAHRELKAAVERLCAAAPTVELGGGRSS